MKETVKSFLLVALTGLLVFLVGVLWFEPERQGEVSQEPQAVYPIGDVSYLIDVESVNIVSDNGQIKTFFYDVANLFSRLKSQIASNMLNLNDSVAISADDYYAAQASNSIEFCLRRNLSTKAVLSILNNSDIIFAPKIDHLYSILLTADGQIYFSGDGVYFKLQNSSPISDIADYLSYLNLANKIVYTTVDKQFNIDQNIVIAERTLLPTAVKADFKPLAVDFETTAGDEAGILKIASRVFGSRLNFVRRFIDVNGSIVMLYGYGEQAMKIGADGTLIVNQKINRRNIAEPNLLKDLKLAVDIIANYSQTVDGLYLKSVALIERDGVTGYAFDFGYRLNGYQVNGLTGLSGAQVEIIGGQLQFLKRHCKRYVSTLPTAKTEQTLPIFAIINKQSNYDAIIEDYAQNHANFVVDERAFMQILANLANFKLLYVDDGNRLLAAYSFDIEDNRYYFDANNFTLIAKEVN